MVGSERTCRTEEWGSGARGGGVPGYGAPADHHVTVRIPSTAPDVARGDGEDSGTCPGDHLAVTLVPSEPVTDHPDGVARTVVRVDNTGTAPCAMRGYGRLGFLAADATPMPSRVQAAVRSRPPWVRVEPGRSAYRELAWLPTAVTVPNEPCVAPEHVVVTPPGAAVPVTVRWPFGQVCASGTVASGPFERTP